MSNFSNYPHPTYQPNKISAYIVSSFVFLSFLSWSIQSAQNRFQPRRLVISICFSHLTILTELLIRAIYNQFNENPKHIYIIMTMFYTIGQRAIIVSNYTYLIKFYDKKCFCFRFIFLSIILSDILMIPAGILSFGSNRIPLSFLFRELSSALICFITILFYFIWFWTQTYSNMSYQSIYLLIVSNLNCSIITIFLFCMSFPKYYLLFNDNEQWFYCFQLFPLLISLIFWSIFHPRRSFTFRTNLK